MKFAALGRHEILYKSIQLCTKSGHQPVLIGTCPASSEYHVKEDDFAHLSSELGCAFIQDKSINRAKYIDIITKSGADIAISFNWLTIINQSVINTFKFGVINAHPGDLPRYRGNACPNWALLSGEPYVTITLHNMGPGLDSGPILLKKQMKIMDETYIQEIYNFMETSIPQMFVEVLDGLENRSVVSFPQPADPNSSLRVFPRLPRDSEINWSLPAKIISRLIRASSEPFSGAYSHIGGDKVIIWRAHAEQLPYPHIGTPGQVAEIRKERGEVAVLTGDGILVLEEIEIKHVRAKATELVRSARTRFGMDITDQISLLANRIDQLEKMLDIYQTQNKKNQ